MRIGIDVILNSQKIWSKQSFATAEKPLFRKSNIADKEVPVMLT